MIPAPGPGAAGNHGAARPVDGGVVRDTVAADRAAGRRSSCSCCSDRLTTDLLLRGRRGGLCWFLEKRGIRITLGTAALLLVEPLLLHKREDAREADAIGDEPWSFEGVLVLPLIFRFEI